MQDFENKVAVVTGAASGLGRAFAERFAREGMRVVLADIEEEALATAVRELEQQERRVVGVVTNTMSRESVTALADRAFEEFGNVHVVCNNAGVVGGAAEAIWELPQGDWDWTMGVNFWGVVHGIHAFVPRMIENGEEGHIVNTASVAGLVTLGGVYGITKHAVLSLSETLFNQLRDRDSKVSASVLCPGFVQTNLASSDRNRPDELLAAGQERAESEVSVLLDQGKTPEEIAEQVFDAVKNDRFYILPHPAWDAIVRERVDKILERGDPQRLDFEALMRNTSGGERF